MGKLQSDELFISPMVSIIALATVVVLLEYGSRFFHRMRQVPSQEWHVLEYFAGELVSIIYTTFAINMT